MKISELNGKTVERLEINMSTVYTRQQFGLCRVYGCERVQEFKFVCARGRAKEEATEKNTSFNKQYDLISV